MRYGLLWLGALSLTLACGCSAYSAAGREFNDRSARIRVQLPEGWLRFTADRKSFTITRDGLRLERITISTARIGEKLPGTERVLSTGMLPLELADVSLGLLRSRECVKNLHAERIDLVTVAENEGYRIDALCVDEHGLPMRLRAYGTMLGNYACEFQFIAAQAVYFEKYLPEFEQLVQSATRR